ncbi:MAG: segregation and condensation protein A [Gammaproteobacteria bacterium]|nr:segregation and condensation protein A [Gammaproteobacteria bacterium]MBL7000693.1 segregation and condensation protein A [Gammaproteobacteria bacterium]
MSNLNNEEKAMEKRIMVMMRQVLSAVARDTAPPAGMRHPLQESTIQGIRDCLSLISARERELNIDLGEDNQVRPRYVDEPVTSKIVSLDSITKKNN